MENTHILQGKDKSKFIIVRTQIAAIVFGSSQGVL